MIELTYVIPAYNAERTLEQTVRSVLSQTDRGVEAVIVDDGSTDDTRHIAGSLLGPRVRLVSQENRGLGAARNAGWRAAAGRALCFLDADDVVAPTHAASMLAGLGDADAVACGYEWVGAGLEDLRWRAPVLAGDTGFDRLIEVNRLAIGAVVLRREQSDALLGGAMFDESLPVHEDWDLFLRMAASGARWARPVEQTLFRYRLGAGSMSMAIERMWRVGERVIERHARDEGEREAGLRGWRLRSVARAVALGDGLHLAEVREALGPINSEDLATFVGALRWALARREMAGPALWEACMGRWLGEVRRLLLDEPALGEILSRLTFGPHRWNSVVERARAMLAPGERLVVYGYGRNGREAFRAAAAAGLAVAVVDDDPTALGKVPAIRAEELRPEDVVLVTPEAREAILARLAQRGISRVVLPDAA